MNQLDGAEPKAAWIVAVWVLSITIAVGFIWATLYRNPQTLVLPANFATLIANNDVLIGSSLSLASLPDDDLAANVLSPNRETIVASLPGISEAHSIGLLESVVSAGAHTVLLEANAFSHEFNGVRHLPWAATLAALLKENGKRLTMAARAAAGLPAKKLARVRLGRLFEDREEFVLAGKPEPILFPRAIWESKKLEATLADARRQGVSVLLYWPPLPKGGFGRDPVRYAEIREHVKALAKRYQLPLWLADGPWPNDLFMDNYGHLNASGRERFAAEIASWANSL